MKNKVLFLCSPAVLPPVRLLKQQTTVKQKAFLRKQLPKQFLKMNLQRPLPLLLLKKRICLSSRIALMKPCSRRHPPDILLKNQM